MNGIGALDEVVFDCRDPERLAPFWLSVLGGEVVRSGAEWVSIRTSAGVGMAFQRVPEAKVNKNRMHLDVAVVDLALGVRRGGGPGRHGVRPDPSRRLRQLPGDARSRGQRVLLRDQRVMSHAGPSGRAQPPSAAAWWCKSPFELIAVSCSNVRTPWRSVNVPPASSTTTIGAARS